MNKNEINCLFTEKVTELLAQGFQINTGTMSGTQGEYARIDFRKGDEVRRIMLDHYDAEDLFPDGSGIGKEYVSLQVGRIEKPIKKGWQHSIWYGRFEIVSETLIEVTKE